MTTNRMDITPKFTWYDDTLFCGEVILASIILDEENECWKLDHITLSGILKDVGQEHWFKQPFQIHCVKEKHEVREMLEEMYTEILGGLEFTYTYWP